MKKQDDFEAYAEDLFHETLLPTLRRKGAVYTGEERSCFHNFESRGWMLDQHIPFVILSDATKQIAAIANWCNLLGLDNTENRLDDIRDRIDDIIIYMMLLRFWMAREEDYA